MSGPYLEGTTDFMRPRRHTFHVVEDGVQEIFYESGFSDFRFAHGYATVDVKIHLRKYVSKLKSNRTAQTVVVQPPLSGPPQERGHWLTRWMQPSEDVRSQTVEPEVVQDTPGRKLVWEIEASEGFLIVFGEIKTAKREALVGKAAAQGILLTAELLNLTFREMEIDILREWLQFCKQVSGGLLSKDTREAVEKGQKQLFSLSSERPTPLRAIR